MQDNLRVALDIGTNSILLLVCRSAADGTLEEVHEDIRMPRLGEKMAFNGGLLEGKAIERGLKAVEELLHSLPSGSHGQAVAAATSAIRDAGNRSLFLDTFAERFGGTPRLLSGEEEAETIFTGAASDMTRPPAMVINIDVGGGSTELALGEGPSNCRFSRSLDIGCVRFGERFDLYDTSSPARHMEVRAEIRRQVQDTADKIKQLLGRSDYHRVIASGGTATSFVEWREKLATYQPRRIHGFRAAENEVAKAAEELAAIPLSERKQSSFIDPGRAAVMPTGLLILSEILRCLQVDEFIVTTCGLRYGLVLRLNNRQLAPTFYW